MTDPVTSLHYAPNNNLVDTNGVETYAPGVHGFNLADVSSLAELNALPAGVKGLVYLNMTDGVTAAFEAAVDQYIGDPKLYGFYVADQPTTVPAATLKAEADYIYANVPGAVTFMWIENMGTPTSPVYNLYNPQNTDIELFGISPQPVRPQFSGGMDLSVIPDAVNAAVAGGIPLADIVPIYQAFGGSGTATYTLPTASQEEQILSTWGQYVPTPAFDFAYSWGLPTGYDAISDEPSLQQVFAAANAQTASAPAAPTITSPAGGSTDTTTAEPVISGTGVTGDTVSVSIDGVAAGTAVVSNSAWSFTPTKSLHQRQPHRLGDAGRDRRPVLGRRDGHVHGQCGDLCPCGADDHQPSQRQHRHDHCRAGHIGNRRQRRHRQCQHRRQRRRDGAGFRRKLELHADERADQRQPHRHGDAGGQRRPELSVIQRRHVHRQY